MTIRKNKGWIKLHRQSLDSAVWTNPVLWRLWCYCLLAANHKDNWVSVDGITEPVLVRRGQFITGRFALHQAVYPKKRKNTPAAYTLWKYLQTLQGMQNLSIKSSNKYSLITICNYDLYQGRKSKNEHKELAATEQQPSTNKKVKNDKNPPYPPNDEPAGNGFDPFWTAYPKKKAKCDAQEAWDKLHPSVELREIILSALEAQKQSTDWQKENGKYIPHPASWLNGRRWEDEENLPLSPPRLKDLSNEQPSDKWLEDYERTQNAVSV